MICTSRCLMKCFAPFLAALFFMFFPAPGKAQTTGRIECARNDDYVYLYSSVTTLDVRTTLQCNEIVRITGRYEPYFAVRTARGEIGYVPLAAIVVLKDQPGVGLPQAATPPPARERTPYDARPQTPPVSASLGVPGFTLRKDTQVHVKALKTVTSATAHSGDAIEFEVLADVLVDGVVVIAKGVKATGVVLDAEPKKRFGHGGNLAFNITSVHLADNEQASLRCFQQISGSSNTSAEAVLPLASGKDAAIFQNAEFTALVDGDMQLKREAFAATKDGPALEPAPAVATQNPQAQRQ
jgi:hypothetical protein